MNADLRQLLAAWLGNELDNDTLAPLIERLKSDDEFREAFVREVIMHGQLRAVQSSEPRWLELEDLIGAAVLDRESKNLESRVMHEITTPGFAETESRNDRHRWQSFALVVGVAASLIGFLALVFWSSDQMDPNQPSVQQIASDSAIIDSDPEETAGRIGVAVLSQAVDVDWGDGEPVATGTMVGTGNLALRSGTIQLDFLSGVRLLVRGPGNLELRGADEVFLREGSASCFVSEMGHGFRIVTKEMEVIDVGTAFSIDVRRGRQPQVHVLEGSVEIKTPMTEMMALQEHHAIRMTDAGPETVPYSPGRFPDPSDLRKKRNESAQRQYTLWQAKAHELSNDPAVLLHYTFEVSDPGALEVRNTAADASNATDGVIIGCDWTTGRWPSKRAAGYRNAGDRILFQVPGDHDSLTMLAWVRIDALTQPITSLLMTESPLRRARFAPTGDRVVQEALARRSTSKVQTVRWELNQENANATFNVGYGNSSPKSWIYSQTAARNPATLSDNWGQWSCLAVTANVTTGEVVHFLNGKRIGTGKLKDPSPLLLDFLELGNFGVSADELERTAGDSQRRFYGVIDEVLIANRVFGDSEIEEIWSAGKP
ncbi:LamG domain-containing protein [Aporhodopirellula aestuarii]|uniref:LamG domain-containing protein n=1 Tax=Aporhodopirellula aestuarii TaxID=2950107 RepID=A0ABT0UDT4_9BACT|nr:LamG domain-containing protein [Aporhodopirellula aestuarii]MCM2375214.1 LamG domain-containing protein [Aporhodopirellula aestuarii]